MSMTRNGVVYDLIKSPYVVEENDIKFYFSSKNHMDKFNENLVDNRNTLSYSLYKRFKTWVNNEQLYDLILYNKIESRGFLVIIEGDEFYCLKEIVLNGVKRISKK